MKRRVALVSSCCPPLPGRPATGGGLRTWQLAETLKAAGHAVVLLVEAAALPDPVPDGIQAFTLDTLEATLKSARASIVVLEQWALAAHLGAVDKPTVIDLHGSLLLENVYRRGELDLTLDAGAKLQALHRADLLLTPAPAQLHHFASWATLAGFDPRELPLKLLPLALPGPPHRRTKKTPALKLVYGGARWPWIDSLDALTAAASTLDELDATLDVFTYEPPRHGLPLDEDLGTWAEVDAALADTAATHHQGVDQPTYAEFLRTEATVALDVWTPNPERILAATTRTGEFLHAGLPVITIAGSAWAEELVASGAGWALPPGDEDALVELLHTLHTHPGRIAAASRAAVALLSTTHSLDTAGAALTAFVANPHRPPRAAATLVESIVAVREAHLDETLRSERAAHEDEHRRLVSTHRAEVADLRAAHTAEVATLSAQHDARADELRGAHRADVDRLSSEARHGTEAQAARHAEEVDALRLAHREELQTLSDEHRAALAASIAEHRQQAEALAEAHKAQAIEAAAERREEVRRITAFAEEQLAEVDAHQRARLAESEERHRTQMTEAVERGASELEAAVADHRSAAEAMAARHRAEVEEIVASWQERLTVAEDRARSDRNQAREARTRLEVELRAELARTEERARQAEASHSETRTDRERLRVELKETRALLDEARATLAARLKNKLGRVDPLDALPGRAKPALHLARLWVEHAFDRTTQGPGPGEG